MESKFTSKRNHLDVPLTQPTSQISLFILGDKISVLHVFMQAVGAHSRSLARRIVNTNDRHLCEIGLRRCATVNKSQRSAESEAKRKVVDVQHIRSNSPSIPFFAMEEDDRVLEKLNRATHLDKLCSSWDMLAEL